MRTLIPTLLLLSLVAFGGFFPGEALALNPNHQCSYCHVSHGAPGFSLLNQANQANAILTAEVVCLSCHGPTGIATKKAAVHNTARSDWRRISCRECHDAHSNQTNYLSATNLKMVGYIRDPANLTSGFATAKIRRIDSNNQSHTNAATIRDVRYENAGSLTWDFAVGANDNHICEVCHSTENFANHRGQDRRGTRCVQCHPHSNGFK